jgi:hypothetical protein
MSQLSEVREAIATTIRNAGWSRGFNVYAYEPTTPQHPSVVISLANDDPIDWNGTYGAQRMTEVRLRARILIPVGSSLETALRILDDVLSQGSGEGSSFADTFYADPTLGGLGAIRALTVTNVGVLERAEDGVQATLVGADVPLTVNIYRS